MREFQTLPGRFHPEMFMSTTGGFLLTGIYVGMPWVADEGGDGGEGGGRNETIVKNGEKEEKGGKGKVISTVTTDQHSARRTRVIAVASAARDEGCESVHGSQCVQGGEGLRHQGRHALRP